MSIFTVSRLGVSVILPVGATNDILLVNTPNFPVGIITFEYTKPSSAKITGIQKCAQVFLKILFTTKGSDLLHPSLGTNLPNLLIGSNNNLSSSELMAQVTTSVEDAVTQCISLLNGSKNDLASQMSSVTINNISSTSVDSMSIQLQLTTMAGETGSISLPSPLLNIPVYNG